MRLDDSAARHRPLMVRTHAMCAAPRLLIASTNPHKLQEFREIFVNLPYELVSPAEPDVQVSVEETGTTFAQNAVLKALAYADAAGMLTLADDSGLEIDALGGEPGIYSARWAGVETPYSERFRIILERLAEIPEEQRTARFRCVIAIARPDGLLATAEGVLEGTIAHEPRG